MLSTSLLTYPLPPTKTTEASANTIPLAVSWFAEGAIASQTCIATKEIWLDLQIEIMGCRTPIHKARSRLKLSRGAVAVMRCGMWIVDGA
eukprot:scaffold18586_cov72-Cyclotella_meneghiniana.AAC.7